MRNVVKVRLYPTAEQQIALSKVFGCQDRGMMTAYQNSNKSFLG
ncbi:helix-turn-helix domain-containing protein [Lyngbya confervoides]|uniref:Helix-turn-helix domain-containing protein n=1 Tax=Lyngbya confervoides BDU141951 TaxID=1574623 RepID=A0ABD4T9E4_9CYAN|nr:helix-turn-helix domain-containing protein [Lyngbya confervoides]MCM1985073.1 helix-turn-helix domain-containing protein [Lyngbya confervoides BDU141951]